ncbi:MAG: methyltransferase [Bacteroidota bacterium]
MTKSAKKTYEPFQFKQFTVEQNDCAMKIGTDGVLLGAWCNVTDAKKALDIGTGSGVIAIMLGQRCDATIHGIEIDESAFLQAKNNMANAVWSDRLTAQKGAIQDYAKLSREEYDLIVSNPPFFSGGTFSDNQDRNNVRHTIKLGHGDLLIAVRKLLSKDGKFCVILPLIEGLRFQEVAKQYALYCTKTTEVKSRPDGSVERLLMQFEKQATEHPIKDELVIYRQKGQAYSAEYIELTKDFYLKM